MTTPAIPKIGFVSLGCPKATVDSERILTQLRAEGYAISASYDDADLVVVNTCGFIDDAIEESMDAIGEALEQNGKVIVTGCLGARADFIREHYPQVLAVTGPAALDQVMAEVHGHLPRQHDPYQDLVPPGGIKLTPRHYAYLKIAEGCNQQCSFCIIPTMRGKLVSRPAGEVLQEAESLVSAGVKELLIVSQDTAAYGVDVKYQTSFWQGRPVKTRITELARAMAGLGAWVRLHYVYPYPHVDQLVELMAEGVLLPYLDVPLQHANPRILKAMRRPANTENMLRRIEQWRKTCPDLVIRSTFIVGFPGETEAEFQQLLEFLETAQLDRVGAFAYSPVEGAAANALPNPVEEEIQQQRLDQFMQTQAKVSAARMRQRLGQKTKAIVDRIEADVIHARSHGEAPEIDGEILIPLPEGRWDDDFPSGAVLDIKISGADQYDLYGEVM